MAGKLVGVVASKVSSMFTQTVVEAGPAVQIPMNATNEIAAEAAESILNPKQIHFMQSSIRNSTGEFTVLGNAESLRLGTLDPRVLRMNVWKDANGKIWTLDHRRLAAFRLSGLIEAPVQWTNPNGQMWKMTTTNGGTSVRLKLGDGTSRIIE